MKSIFLLILLTTTTGVVYGQSDFYHRLADSTVTLTFQKVTYDPAYYRLDYPGGDVPPDRGVCTDVIIRAYRKLGIDLQKEVHTDIALHFQQYPDLWGLRKPDSNIDHRRVPNLMVFFQRNGIVKQVSADPEDYLPGDIVCYDLGRGILHIGMVVMNRSDDGKRPLVVHNIGAGQVMEDCLFRFRIIGHYRYKKETP